MKNNFKDTLVFVAGGGFFGKKASQWFKDRDAKVLVVDIDREKAIDFVDIEVDISNAYSEIDSGVIGFLKGDATDCFIELTEVVFPKIVVPAIPGHFLGRISKKILTNNGFEVKSIEPSIFKEIVNEVPDDLILTKDYENGVLITSYMQEGECSENCPQPIDICTATQKNKNGLMSDILDEAIEGFSDYHNVLISHGINGAGYIEGSDIQKLIKDIHQLESGATLSIGTSCSCHGILNCIKI
ncbi:Pyridine nucleotide-disulfide oxidoreductase [Methanonatronarchaeum thermophilum]|uniref:Pyridine nucleotide-disulfide oxidoreductase n=1 Tax=Methanonatronarchaeum thermophilum TaxID=1927129 RepID=A0A1Y3GB15_9EURY|nr:hypothetical protein [Methanonatronarchaeum thermophilum]OUJ18652.1 Pyridine nucleotide-disulfide oxidoreductase [Methanonatronarchaeum thermophilum]